MMRLADGSVLRHLPDSGQTSVLHPTSLDQRRRSRGQSFDDIRHQDHSHSPLTRPCSVIVGPKASTPGKATNPGRLEVRREVAIAEPQQ